ncbi:MAG: ribonuclease III [Ilumatobacteraceae bacterium]|nr:ribonuclease III [Ilumatobacteraceae bacterium]
MSDLENSALSECASRIGYEFQNPMLLRQALIHRSWQAENSDPLTNERFEFLGDAVLGWVIADVAFHRLADMPEGKLTDLRRSVVNMHALADIARQLGIGEFLLLGKGEDAAGGRDKSSILADALEALIGAVYLDGGAPAAYEMVKRLLGDSVEEAIPHLEMFDAKTRLQELCARLSIGVPTYGVEGEGPDHERVFTAILYVDGRAYGSGSGRTKKAAEQIAAVGAYDALVEQHNA